MKLHTVFITHNRLELTKQAIESYLETVTLPFHFVVIDNGSTDGTVEWLYENYRFAHYALGENRYPGFAANFGWSEPFRMHFGATHLHRADNDFVFLPEWCNEVERMFQDPFLGQLGLRTDEEELFASANVGGNCIITRELWDKGLRWDERSWPQLRDEVGAGFTEDSLLSEAVRMYSYNWDRVKRPCIRPISYEAENDPYYLRTWADRGIQT